MRCLSTPRLSLEPQVVTHAQEMFVVLSDPAIYTYENAPPVSLDWLRERYRRLESRCSADGSERWLNWVMRLSDGAAIGYVQATLTADGRAGIAYEMASEFWGRGLAQEAVRAMMAELNGEPYHVKELTAILKAGNVRSRRLLERLGFSLREPDSVLEADEIFMSRRADHG